MIHTELINKHIERKRKISEETVEEWRHIVRPHDFFSRNEILISEIIRKIQSYQDYFCVLEEYKFVKIGQMSEIVVTRCESITNDQYLLCKYENRNQIKFSDFLYDLPTPKLFLQHVLETYSFLLISLQKLNENNICFFNISYENIMIRENLKPILVNFDKSILYHPLLGKVEQKIHFWEKWSKTSIKDFAPLFSKVDDKVDPLEVRAMCYLNDNDENTMTPTIVDTICDEYVKNLTVLQFFSRERVSQFENDCRKFLEQYINRTRSDIIIDLLRYANTWDNYGLSVMYLHLLGTMSKVFSLKSGYVIQMMDKMFNNIGPKRQSIITPLRIENAQSASSSSLITAPFGGVLNERRCNTTRESEIIDWSFVKDMDIEKMDELRAQLRF